MCNFDSALTHLIVENLGTRSWKDE